MLFIHLINCTIHVIYITHVLLSLLNTISYWHLPAVHLCLVLFYFFTSTKCTTMYFIICIWLYVRVLHLIYHLLTCWRMVYFTCFWPSNPFKRPGMSGVSLPSEICVHKFYRGHWQPDTNFQGAMPADMQSHMSAWHQRTLSPKSSDMQR